MIGNVVWLQFGFHISTLYTFFNSSTYCFNVHILPIHTFIWIGVVKGIAQPLFVFQDFRSHWLLHTFFVYPVIQHLDMFVFISSVPPFH